MKRVHASSHRFNDIVKGMVENIRETGSQRVQSIRTGETNPRYRKLHILRCMNDGCEKKFWGIGKKRNIPYVLMHKYCSKCYGELTGKKKFVIYKDVTKEDKQRLEREMDACGCTVRKMTEEEREKFLS